MKSDIIKFFKLQRQIFGVCPKSGQLFRLSECKIYSKKKPKLDWMDDLHKKEESLYRREDRLNSKEREIRNLAREKGRRLALKTARKIDMVFTPKKLNPNDSKVIFHPIDYIVFNKMNGLQPMKEIILLDRKAKNRSFKIIQRSIEKVIEKENYEWRTLRIQNDGKIKETS